MRRLLATLFFLMFTACTGSDVLKPIPKGSTTTTQGKGAVTTARAPIEIKKEIDCCWCTTKPDGQNEVRVYANEELCEEKSGKDNYFKCKKVRAMGDRCVLASRRVGRGGKYICTPMPLEYLENNLKREITPPADVAAVCAAENWFDKAPTAMNKKDKADSDLPSAYGEEEDEKDDIYCGCGKDPSNSNNCAAFKSVNGNVQTLDTKPRAVGDVSCLREVCEKLWNFDDFLNVCPRRFVQFQP